MPSRCDRAPALKGELDRMKVALGITDELEIVWRPDPSKSAAGEVKGRTILLYDDGLDSALMTLKHELVDYAISKAIGPYMDVTNALMKVINEHAY